MEEIWQPLQDRHEQQFARIVAADGMPGGGSNATTLVLRPAAGCNAHAVSTMRFSRILKLSLEYRHLVGHHDM